MEEGSFEQEMLGEQGGAPRAAPMDDVLAASAVDQPERYDAFVSYSTWPDYFLVRRLEAFLESFHQRKALRHLHLRPLRVCVDGSDFKLDRRWNKAGGIPVTIQDYLGRSDFLLVLGSRGAASSRWVDEEVQHFVDRGEKSRILVAVTESAAPDETPEDIFPKALIACGHHCDVSWYDFRRYRFLRSLRWSKVRNFDDNRVRLACDLLGLTSGEALPIYLRDRLRRRSIYTVVGVVLAAVFVGLFVLSRTKAAEAKFHRSESEKNSLIAERERKQKLTNRAFALFSRGLAAEVEGKPLEAKILMASALIQHDSPEIRRRLIGTWFAEPRWEWDQSYSDFPPPSPVERSIPAATVVFSPDGESIITADPRGKIGVWVASTGAILRSTEVGAEIADLAVNAAGTLLVIGRKDRKVELRGLESLEIEHEFEEEHDILAVAVSRDGSLLAVGLEGAGLKVIQIATRKEVASMDSHGYSVGDLAFVLGNRAVIWTAESRLFLTDLDSDNKTDLIDRQSTWIESVAVADKLGLVAAGGGDRSVNLVHLSRGPLASLKGHAELITDVSLDGQRARVLSASNDGTVRIWRLLEGGKATVLSGHIGPVWAAGFSPNGDRVAAIGADGRLRSWSVAARNGDAVFDQSDDTVSSNTWIAGLFSRPDGGLIIVNHGGHIFTRKETEDGAWATPPKLSTLGIQQCKISPSRTRLAVVPFHSKDIVISKIESGESVEHEVENLGHFEWLSDDEIAVILDAKRLHVLDLRTGAISEPSVVLKSKVEDMVVLSDNRLVVVTENGTVVIVDVKGLGTPRPVMTVDGALEIVVSADGSDMAVIGKKECVIGSIRDHAVHCRIPGVFTCAAFSPDGRWVALSTFGDTRVILCRRDNGETVASYTRHDRPIRHLLFSSDGSHLLSGGEDRTVRIWSVAEMAELAVAAPSTLLEAATRHTGLLVRDLYTVPLESTRTRKKRQ